LEEGTLEQRKEFLRGFVHEISIDPDAARGVITLLRAAHFVSNGGAGGPSILKMIVSTNLDRFALNEEAWRGAA
jgi:hypothetical protein